MRVVVAGGGTAGHVFPALALAHTLAAEHGADVRFLGTATGLESRLVPAAGFPFTAVEAKPLERRLSPRSLGRAPSRPSARSPRVDPSFEARTSWSVSVDT